MIMKKSTCRAAKKQLKSHLKRRGDCHLTVSEGLSWYWWRIINRAVFNNALPIPSKIVVRRLRGAWGLCWGKRKGTCVITISSDIQSRKLFLETLCHEMVHQYQWLDKKSLDHGSSFREWKSYFRSNFNIGL